ncbi:5-formyltetrahydrofolate cyclo-ligase, partial [Paracoccus aestuarii]
MTDKPALRAQALAARAAGGDAAALDRHLRAALAPHAGAALAGYWPIRDEADPRPAMRAHDGPLLLPVVTARDHPLTFRLWRGEPLEPGPLGTAPVSYTRL